ncbi:hypothetical protein [Streptomyces phaeochromogenes]|uniref:hypothetical protein n=1 Tax=Streptomyces phaeochromogenes TaxID=1923 RepID=UPI002DDC6188|nr:hypothetical protein [Streptomyces phaeochromogenes]WRZ30152.1 hypothetical protein OG931_21595 [Streptomyces phaeochromogenes]
MVTQQEQHAAGDEWLASCAENPDLAREAWEFGALAPIRTGKQWLAAEAPLATVLIAMNRIPALRRGPTLVDPSIDLAWWLVPLAGSEECFRHVDVVTVHSIGWPLLCPPTGRPLCNRFWVNWPDGSGHLTDPVQLAAVLGIGGGPRLPAEAYR